MISALESLISDDEHRGTRGATYYWHFKRVYLHIVNNLFRFATQSDVNMLSNTERLATGVFV